jgi:hypothetical protein
MKITNKLGLPEAFVQMAQSDYKPTPKRYSATALLKGVREVVLERRHGDEIEIDVSDMIWALFGQAVHSVLEHQKEGTSELKEEYASMPVEGVPGYSVSGRFDLYNAEKKTITDYKVCSVWKVIFGDFSDWKKQILVYAAIMEYCGFPVEWGEVIPIMRDYSNRDAKIKPDYPQSQVAKIRFKVDPSNLEQIKTFIHDRISQLAAAEALPDNGLPICTPEERFNSGDKYAVMRKGRKTALRVLASREEAEQWMQDNGGDSIQCRAGEDKKCKDYCSACQFCNYYREHVKGAG